jgi:hypothetical protein
MGRGVTDTLGLTTFREYVAQLLRDNLPDEYGVLDSIPDSIAPPAVYVTWSTPWMVPTTFCEYVANLQLILVAQRIEPGGQYGTLESMLGDVVTILKGNGLALRDVTSPYPIILGGNNYLAASVNVIHEIGD